MKKIVFTLGILYLSIIMILNIFYTSSLEATEHVTTNFNNILYIIGIIFIGILIFYLTKIVNEYLYKDENIEKRKKIKKYSLIVGVTIYIIFNIVWISVIRPPIIADQGHVCDLAETFFTGNLETFLNNNSYAGISMREYMECYRQQIPLAFVFSIVFRIIHVAERGLLRILNILANVLIVFALYKINVQLSKKYKTNKTLLFTLILTFLSIPMLATFVYGDVLSLACSLFSVYFAMKYIENNKIKYAIYMLILSALAYILRMNSLIFVIATVIYLLLNLFKNIAKNNIKENLIQVLIIATYIIISIMPSQLIQNYYLTKYDLNKENVYPKISYFLIGMEESHRANGWYSEDIGEKALKDTQNIKQEYKQKIKERLIYFSKHIGYTINFYTMKIASMWTENTYSAVRNNTIEEKYSYLENIISPLTFYQKVLLIIMCFVSLIILIQNRKNLSLDLIFLLTIFVGGFTFHMLWEAKSRYIIPYIIILIPIASININNIKKGEKYDKEIS